MGAWGTKIYQDGIALDIKDEFKNLLHRGKEAREWRFCFRYLKMVQ